jgi:serine/threonine protein kinase
MLMKPMDGPLDSAKLGGTLKSILLMFVAKSLLYLHSKGIVHLDLTPANILLKGGRAKIGDCGSAKVFGASVTQTNIALMQRYAGPVALDDRSPPPPHCTRSRSWRTRSRRAGTHSTRPCRQ